MRGRRRGGGLPIRLIGVLAGVALLAIGGGVIWFAGQAEKNAPEQREIRIEATNVGAS